MSVRVMALVWDAPFPSATAKLVALKLADCANDDGANVFPSRRTIELATECSQSAVKNWLAAFEAGGLLTVERRSRGGARCDTTVRRFSIAMLQDLAGGKCVFVSNGKFWTLACPLPTDGHDQRGRQVTGSADDRAIKRARRGQQIPSRGPANGPKPSKTHHEPGARVGARTDFNFDLNGKGVRDRLRKRFGSEIFTAWFASVAFSRDGTTAIAAVPNAFIRNWIRTHYEAAVLAACQAEWPDVARIKFVCVDASATPSAAGAR